MHRIIRTKAYEAEHGPHFNEEHARKAVNKMENEDGTRGQHWSLEETTALANQYGIRLDEKINKYDWYVALNMVYSDYYRVIVNITGTNNTKFFVELAKAWICDKDIDEGKMWFYYIYVMCDKIRNAEEDLYERHYSKYEDDDEEERYGNYRRWVDLHMVDVENTTENTMKETLRRREKERNPFLWKKNSNVVVLCATLDINQIKSILNKINYVRR